MQRIDSSFEVTNANLNVAFHFQGKDGYSTNFRTTLAEIQLPGIGIKDFLYVNPYAQLNAQVGVRLSGGTTTINNIGLKYDKVAPLTLHFDFLNGGATQSGWNDAAPTILQPYAQHMSTARFKASIGPAFGIAITALTFTGKGSIGLEAPLVDLVLAPSCK
jgi:hypothetical protein